MVLCFLRTRCCHSAWLVGASSIVCITIGTAMILYQISDSGCSSNIHRLLELSAAGTQENAVSSSIIRRLYERRQLLQARRKEQQAKKQQLLEIRESSVDVPESQQQACRTILGSASAMSLWTTRSPLIIAATMSSGTPCRPNQNDETTISQQFIHMARKFHKVMLYTNQLDRNGAAAVVEHVMRRLMVTDAANKDVRPLTIRLQTLSHNKSRLLQLGLSESLQIFANQLLATTTTSAATRVVVTMDSSPEVADLVVILVEPEDNDPDALQNAIRANLNCRQPPLVMVVGLHVDVTTEPASANLVKELSLLAQYYGIGSLVLGGPRSNNDGTSMCDLAAATTERQFLWSVAYSLLYLATSYCQLYDPWADASFVHNVAPMIQSWGKDPVPGAPRPVDSSHLPPRLTSALSLETISQDWSQAEAVPQECRS